MQAVASGYVEIAKLLIEAGADIEDDANLGIGLPIQLASFLDYPNIVKLLIARDANLHARGYWGETALEIAKAEGNREVIAVLEKALLVERRSASV